MMNNETEILVIAALLHDIGKFAQRAGRPKSPDMEGEYCPTDKQGKFSTHKHVLYSDYFIEHDLPLPPELEGQRARLARLASAHHKPAGDSLLEQALSQADRLSAGMDRTVPTEDAGDYMSARLLSTFCQVSLRGGNVAEKRYYPLGPLEDDPFPRPLEEARAKDYAAAFDLFRKDLPVLPLDQGVRNYVASLVSLLEKHTWCVPSSTYKTEPDISLYDHAVTTAAIAQALFVFHKTEGGAPGQGATTTPKFILFGGDLSGIQKYIFGLEKSHGTGVAKILRARSFHLQALTRSVVLALLDEAGLLPQARIVDAGGRFILLLPATRQIRSLLPEFETRVQRWFLDAFQGRLSLNLTGELLLTEADFDFERLQARLDDLWDRLEVAKLRKFGLVLAGDGNHGPVQNGDFSHGACQVCTINPVDPDAGRKYLEAHERELHLCAECYEQIEHIGRKLPQKDIKFAVFARSGQQGLQLFDGITLHFARAESRHLGTALEIVNLRERGACAYAAVAGHLPTFTRDDEQRWAMEGRRCGPEEDVRVEEPKTFGQLAQEARIADRDGLRGKAFLGAFKADVDNLGVVFSMGLGKRLSISRFAGLSRMLNHFFAEYMVARIERDYPDIYVVFAGGDDLFLVGPWTTVLDFAVDLRQEFGRYVAGNPDLALSAGIFVCKPTLPATAMARGAEDLLEAAKGFTREGKDARAKDAVSLFGVTTGWERFDFLLGRGRWLESLAREEVVPYGLLMRLLRYADDCRAFRSGIGGRRKGMYLSHMLYDFARNLKKELPADDRQQLEGLARDPGTLEQMRLSVSSALYRLRTE